MYNTGHHFTEKIKEGAWVEVQDSKVLIWIVSGHTPTAEEVDYFHNGDFDLGVGGEYYILVFGIKTGMADLFMLDYNYYISKHLYTENKDAFIEPNLEPLEEPMKLEFYLVDVNTKKVFGKRVQQLSESITSTIQNTIKFQKESSVPLMGSKDDNDKLDFYIHIRDYIETLDKRILYSKLDKIKI